jgi:hypothetical protein
VTGESEWERVFQALARVSGPARRWARTIDVAVAAGDGRTAPLVARRLQELHSGGRVDMSTDRTVTGLRGTCWRPRPAVSEG